MVGGETSQDETLWTDLLVQGGCDPSRAGELSQALVRAMSSALGPVGAPEVVPLGPGECYAHLFRQGLRRDVLKLGLCPDVATLRRFANSVKDPHGDQLVDVTMHFADEQVLCHTTDGVIPAGQVLAALAKHVRVGANPKLRDGFPIDPDGGVGRNAGPVGVALTLAQLKEWHEPKTAEVEETESVSLGGRVDVSDTFPPGWIPAIRHSVLAYDHKCLTFGEGVLDVNAWQISHDGLDNFMTMTDRATRVQWHFWLHPLAPKSDEFTVFLDGVANVCSEWHSPVSYPGYFTRYSIRGLHVMARVDFWRPSRLLLGQYIPGAPHGPMPPIIEESEHTDLLALSKTFVRDRDSAEGYCYLKLLRESIQGTAKAHLGAYPTASAIRAFADENPMAYGPEGVTVTMVGDGVAHVTHGPVDPESALAGLRPSCLVGSTQAPIEVEHDTELGERKRVLELPVRQAPLSLQVPLVCVLDSKPDTNTLTFAFRKLGGTRVARHFESVRLSTLSFTFTIVGGDNEAVMIAAIDPYSDLPKTEASWFGAPHSVVLSGNANGSTSASFELPSNHTFGRELKGTSLGNAPPVLHCKLTSKVAAKVIVRGMAHLEVLGVGHVPPHNMANSAAKAVASASGALRRNESDSDSEAEAGPSRASPPRQANSANKRV